MEQAKERNTEIYKDRLQGATFVELGRKYEISANRIRTVCEKEKKREERKNNWWYNRLIEIADNEQLAAKTCTVLERLGATTEEEIMKLDVKQLKGVRLCGNKMIELIFRVQEQIKAKDYF